jgi:hypothetical protein
LNQQALLTVIYLNWKKQFVSDIYIYIYNMIFGTELKEKKIKKVKKFQHEWGKDDIFQLHFWLKNYIY